MFLPPAYVAEAIRKDMTPRQAWDVIGARIIGEGKADKCRPLINWLKLAMTKVRATGMSVLATAEPAAVMGDEVLFAH